MELDFDLGMEVDLITFHFWNYHSESYDVDDIDLTFFDSSMQLVGTFDDISPALGNATGLDATPIFAEDSALATSGVQFVNAALSGSNGQVDFSNIGFTAVPEPTSGSLLLLGLSVISARARIRRLRF